MKKEKRVLIEIIRARTRGEMHDVETYFLETEKIIGNAYRKCIGTFGELNDPVLFANNCWDKMEDELIYKLSDILSIGFP